ncbi:MAG: hypothetical protein KF805_10025 [Phycisphaeraceae bacterium]|nr:hypothetical protein [Phycisphaeraceae bacterium]
MRYIFGVALLFWAAASLYFAYSSFFVAGAYQHIGWSYVEYPLRQAFGETNQSSQASQKMWAQAIQNAREYDPSVGESQIELSRWIADGLVKSASANLRTNSRLWVANAAVCIIAGFLLIWRTSENLASPKAAS